MAAAIPSPADSQGSHHSSSIPNSQNDPPLYLSGRHFAEVPGLTSQQVTPQDVHHIDSMGTVTTLTHSYDAEEHARRMSRSSRSAGVDLVEERSRENARDVDCKDSADNSKPDPIEHIAGESITDAEAAGYSFAPEEDEELAAAVAMLNEHAKLKRRENGNIHLLELTSAQLAEMVDESSGMTKIEYFDTKYFSDEARKVWHEREQSDLSPDSKHTVRLHAGTRAAPESAILKYAQEARLRRESDSTAPEAFALKHPLLHRRAARNEERRAAFRAAAVERVQANEAPSMRTVGSDLSTKSIYSPQRDLFGPQRDLSVHFGPVTAAAAAPQRAAAAAAAAASGDSADSFSSDTHPVVERHSSVASEPSPPPLTRTATLANSAASNDAALTSPKKSLAELMAEQRELMAQMKRHDETVYRPVLDAFYRYDAAVQDKMTRLLDRVNSMSNPAAPRDAADAAGESALHP
jgi:hypothetical protein